MTFTWDLNAATLLILITNLVVVVAFAMRTSGKAEAAAELAAIALKCAKDAHVKIDILTASIALLREHVAEKYVDRIALREMEQRLVKAIDKLGERLDQLLTRK